MSDGDVARGNAGRGDESWAFRNAVNGPVNLFRERFAVRPGDFQREAQLVDRFSPGVRSVNVAAVVAEASPA